MKRARIGLGLGLVAGLLDVTPMIIKGLPWSANISAFTMWLIIGFLIATSDLKLPPIAKGLLISFLSLVSPAVLIAWSEPMSLAPISAMTAILGSALGYAIHRLAPPDSPLQPAPSRKAV
jgi:hypothetical protein